MDGDVSTVEVVLGSFDADRELSEHISRTAEECCIAANTDGSFVMITTELRQQAVVKLVHFEDASAAERFRSRVQQNPAFTPKD